MNVEMPRVEPIHPNFCRVFTGNIVIWFSYQTPVAFRFPGGRLVVRRNDWGPTTGKHLNAIDNGDHKRRVNKDTFEALYAEMMKEFKA